MFKVLVFKDRYFLIMSLNTSYILHVHNQRNSVLVLEKKLGVLDFQFVSICYLPDGISRASLAYVTYAISAN